MILHTEKEQLIKTQEFAYRLRNLYLTDMKLFNQVNDCIPFSVFTNRQDNLNISYSNKKLERKGPEMEMLVTIGSSYLPKISCPILLNIAKNIAEKFHQTNDKNSVCSYLQNFKINGKMNYFYASKLFLDEQHYFNIGNFTDDLGMVGSVFKKVFDSVTKSEITWLKFQSLTKQEKVILRLIAKSHSTSEIGDLLFISKHTVQTHRKNINKKLDTNKISDLVHFAMVLELIDDK